MSNNNNNGILVKFSKILNANIKALNVDGISYKHANLDLSNSSKMILRAAESFGDNSQLNLIYDSDNITTAAQLNLTTGSVLYLAVKKEYLLIYSYLPATAVFGSSPSNIWNGICEHSREDPWSAGYPTYLYLQSDSFSTTYSPRLKIGVGIDTTGNTATLALQPTYSLAKQALNAAGTMPVHTAVDLRFSNTTSWTYAVLGGKLLGGLKRTTDNFGTNLDETVINNTTYVVWCGGVGNTAFRFLVPKE